MHLQAIAPLPPISQEDGLSLTCICLNSHHQPSWVHPMINIQRDILFSSLTFQLNKYFFIALKIYELLVSFEFWKIKVAEHLG